MKEYKQIPIDDDFGLMMNCAVRYAMGRSSYMPGAVMRYLAPLLPYFDKRTLACFVSDYEFFDEDVKKGIGSWGMETDQKDWHNFYLLCKKTLKEKENPPV